MPREVLNAWYSDAEGVKTFYDEEQGLRCIDHGYRIGQEVRVQKQVRGGVEIVIGKVVSLQPDCCLSPEYINKYPATISVQAIWKNGIQTTVAFDPVTKFPPDFSGEQYHFQELLD